MRDMGLKLLPTQELVSGIAMIIQKIMPIRVAMINAGDGLLARELDVFAVDRCKDWRADGSKNDNGMALTPYGVNVKYVKKLEEVLDYSVTHRVIIGLFVPSRNEPSNEAFYSAPDEVEMMKKIWIYIHIGDEMISSFKAELLKEYDHYRVTQAPLIVWSPKIKPVIDVYINPSNAPDHTWEGLTAAEVMHKLSFP